MPHTLYLSTKILKNPDIFSVLPDLADILETGSPTHQLILQMDVLYNYKHLSLPEPDCFRHEIVPVHTVLSGQKGDNHLACEASDLYFRLH